MRPLQLVLATLLVATLAAPSSHPIAASSSPVVVELFTSEGCSDCPPADTLLSTLASTTRSGEPTIVALSEHVDYWDRQGWRDRFSSAAFTRRQQAYSARFNLDSIYTPQMVVDGAAEFVGSDAAAARRAIAKAAAAAHGVVTIVFEPPVSNHVTVAMSASELPKINGGDRVDMVLAITEDGLKSDVKRGENHGRTLSHVAVLRQLVTIGEASPDAVSKATGELTLDPEWQRDRLKIVAFVQERRGRRILASTAAPLTMTGR